MADYEAILQLRGAHLRIKFDDAEDLERKLEGLDLSHVARVLADAVDRLPRPPGHDLFLEPAAPE